MKVTKAIQTLESLQAPAEVGTADADSLKQGALKVYEYADALQINTNTELIQAEAFIKACSDQKKKLKAPFVKTEERLRAAKRNASEALQEFTGWLDSFIGVVEDGMKLAEQKARIYRLEEQKKIDAENARKREEAKAEAEAEKKKQVAELKAAGTKDSKDAAKRLAEEPVEVAPIIEAKLPDAPAGVIHRESWTCEPVGGDDVAGLALLLEAAYKEPMRFIRFLSVNMVALNAEARIMKENFSVPGFTAVNKGSTAHR